MVAAGVAGSIPWATSSADTAGRVATPIMITSVVLARASADQSRVLPGWSGGRWAETMVTPWVRLRWVSGMPASAGAAIAELTPGITVTGTPASAQASSSSPPRPKMKLSPPFSRTTRRPARPCSTRSSLIRSCEVNSPRGILATSITSTPAGAWESTARGASRSQMITSALWIAARPGHGEQPGVAGTAADQRDVADAGRGVAGSWSVSTAARHSRPAARAAPVMRSFSVRSDGGRYDEGRGGEIGLRPAASVPGDQRPVGEIPHGGRARRRRTR